jgi:hypothetical protein
MSEGPNPGVTVGSGTVTDIAEESRPTAEAGEHTLFEQATKKVQSIMDQKVEKIRTDETIDDHERHLRIREEYTKAEGIMAQARAAYENELRLDVEESEKGLFQADNHSPSAVNAAYERVFEATRPFDFGTYEGMEHAEAELERYAERARRTGDQALEIAVAHIAIERGLDGIRDTYLASPGNKERMRAWERFNAARAKQEDWEDKHANFERTLRGVGILQRPPEL